MATTPKRTCKHCEQRKPEAETHLVRRYGGGSYRQAGRMIPTTICDECIVAMAPEAQRLHEQGHRKISRWDTHAIIRLAARINAN